MKSQVTTIFIVVFVLFISTACGSVKVASETAPISTPTPIPGWNYYEASGISMGFPGSWNGGDLENDLEIIVSSLKSLGPDFESMAEMIESNPSAFLLWIFDSNITETGYLTSANVTQEKVLSAITLDAYINAFQKQLPDSMVITDQKAIQLNQYEAFRMEITWDTYGAKELVYIVKNENTVWAITLATGANEFEDRLPIFEQIAGTFSIQE